MPERLPEVVARIGIDLNPLDPADPDDRAWLRALVWPGPDGGDRLRRLDAACEIARREPAVLLTGDARGAAPGRAGARPRRAARPSSSTPPCWPTSRGRPGAFRRPCAHCPVRWIAQEAPGVVPGTGEAPGDGSWGEHFVLSLDGRPVAHTAPHGGRIEWLDAA